MAEKLPDIRVVVVPGAGHAVALERPDVIARLF
jgi:pimeloyl-ACP methyl ester carboxylesterase